MFDLELYKYINIANYYGHMARKYFNHDTALDTERYNKYNEEYEKRLVMIKKLMGR
jgi:hypothetical protein